MDHHLRVNREHWDERAPAHAASPDYGLGRFADPGFVSDVVRFDRDLLGDVAGLRGVHLQCHLGTDTLSLARLGATMTGLDFSAASLAVAWALSERCGPEVTYVESDVYDALTVLEASTFELVFTGIGALCWLPDIRGWAAVVANLLAPGGRLFLREGHPVLWALDDERHDDLLALTFPYFEQEQPLRWDGAGTYVRTDVQLTKPGVTWNHGLGAIVTALLDEGLSIAGLTEHDTVPWEALPGRMRRVGRGEWQLTDHPERLPHTYTLQAVKAG